MVPFKYFLLYFSVAHGSGHSNLDLEFLPILKQITFKKNKAIMGTFSAKKMGTGLAASAAHLRRNQI